MNFVFNLTICLFAITVAHSTVMATDDLQTANSISLIHHIQPPTEATTGHEFIEDTTVTFTTYPSENYTYTKSGNLSVKRYIIDENHYIDKISIPLTTVVGIIGNAATVIALQGYPFSTIPSSYILVSLAIADSATLVSILLKNAFFIEWIGYDIRLINIAACKVFNFVVHSSKILSAWFVVLICFERCVAICMPLRTKRICTKTNALKGIVTIIIVAVFYSGIWTLSSEINKSKCNPSFSTPETRLRGKIIILVGSALIGIIPMLILIILTPIMCVVLYRYGITRKDMMSTQARDTTKVSTMLIALCFTYVILQLPLIGSHNLAAARGEDLESTSYLPLVVLYKVSSVLEAINYSCNFFLYIACNRIFRRKVARFCLCYARQTHSTLSISHSSETPIYMVSAATKGIAWIKHGGSK